MKDIGIRIVGGLMTLFSKLPLGFHYFCGDFISWYCEKVHRYRTNDIIINISRAFPNIKYKQIKKISSDFYKHFGEIFAETIWFRGTNYKKLREKNICKITNIEVLEKAYKNSPSVTLLSSHCGNWELLGGFLAYIPETDDSSFITKDDFYVVYKKLRSPMWDKIMKQNRRAPIGEFDGEIESNDILRLAIKNRGNKAIYIYINDQSPYKHKENIGIFLNQETKAMMGSINLAHKLGMSIVYQGMKHIKRGRYEMTYTNICNDASKEEPEVLIRKYFSLLEKDIIECPYNWLWSHRRWK